MVVTVLTLASAARAQSAYFCTQKGYLAYDTRTEFTPGAEGHVLRLIRFEPERGIFLAGDVELPPLFTLYHVICTQDRVTVTGFLNVVSKYVIDLGESRPALLSSTTDSGQTWSEAAREGPQPTDLGIFGRVPPLPLGSDDSQHEYRLVRSSSTSQTKQGPERHIKSEIVRLDIAGTILQRFVLYERRYVQGGE
ncbi:MAG TPA: hypothetical protein VNW47_05140 [Terriglobales bacterium]|nr:hypothetical protein [Terriglobales bacterium]